MTQIRRMMTILAVSVIFTLTCCAQSTAKKKAYTFHGKVEAVHKDSDSLTVNGEKVDGWMDAMTMDYKVDNPAVLSKVKAGDQITATVYDGDYSLHNVQVAGNSKGK
jgi:protein SCO1